MTLDEARFTIPQYLSGQLSAAEQTHFEALLAESDDLRRELAELRSVWDGLAFTPDSLEEAQPSPALRARFYQRLNAETRRSPEKPASALRKFFSWHFALPQLAAGLVLFLAGRYTVRDAGNDAQMRTQVQTLRETVALSLLDRQSATSRLEGVSWSNQVDKPDQQLRSALLRTLNQDPNVNVRLASLDALEKFSSEPAVRKELVDSISLQDSPLVQIALIDAIVHMHDHDAAMQLKKVTADTQLNEAVRQRARWGLKNLGL